MATKFCTVIKTSNVLYSSWMVKYAPNKSELGDDRNFDNRKSAIFHKLTKSKMTDTILKIKNYHLSFYIS